MFYDVACRGQIDKDTAFRLLSGKISEGAVVNTDKHSSYPSVMMKLKAECHNAYSAHDHAPMNRVNALHSRMRTFLKPFGGVSTRRLDLYLAWFKWSESFKRDSTAESIELTMKQMVCGIYDTSRKKLKNTPYPFRGPDGNDSGGNVK